jgi:hypothetical protein
MTSEQRPDISNINASAELRRWYWTKAELTDECRRLGLKLAGGKFTLLDRIAHFHDTGERRFPGDRSQKVTSKFDWHSAPLAPDTVITDSYKNTQNARRFFTDQVGPQFRFNTAFMAWMKTSSGQTLADAVVEYRRLSEAAARPGHQSKIADHNQFNQYTRDFLADNPELGMKEVRHFWALKRALPSEDGRHRYDPSDLELEG